MHGVAGKIGDISRETAGELRIDLDRGGDFETEAEARKAFEGILAKARRLKAASPYKPYWTINEQCSVRDTGEAYRLECQGLMSIPAHAIEDLDPSSREGLANWARHPLQRACKAEGAVPRSVSIQCVDDTEGCKISHDAFLLRALGVLIAIAVITEIAMLCSSGTE